MYRTHLYTVSECSVCVCTENNIRSGKNWFSAAADTIITHSYDKESCKRELLLKIFVFVSRRRSLDEPYKFCSCTSVGFAFTTLMHEKLINEWEWIRTVITFYTTVIIVIIVDWKHTYLKVITHILLFIITNVYL